jgi:hypothetical protein
MCKATGPCDCEVCTRERAAATVTNALDRVKRGESGLVETLDALAGDAIEREAEEIGRQTGAAIKHADLGAAGRFAFAVLVQHTETDEPTRDMMATDLDEAIRRACTWAKNWGRRAYVYQLVTIAEPSYHLTDLREKARGG